MCQIPFRSLAFFLLKLIEKLRFLREQLQVNKAVKYIYFGLLLLVFLWEGKEFRGGFFDCWYSRPAMLHQTRASGVSYN